MKILLACMLRSYGDPSREYSYEYFNFYLTLKNMGHEVELFDYMDELRTLGKSGMNQKLQMRVKNETPDLTIFSLYTDQFDPDVIAGLREHTKTFGFFHDDTWRVEYSRFWARHFNFFSTPDLFGPDKYQKIGLPNAIYFPFGCNEHIFKNVDARKEYDVSFVGAWHPYRQWMIEKIRAAGVNVQAFGYGWPDGEAKQEVMVQIFNQSKVNLNLSNSASWDVRYLLSSPRAIINRIRSQKNIEQMKARIFEINACAGFQLSYFVEGLANCYDIDREISVYSDIDDLIAKIRFFLANDSLRESIGIAGHKRSLRDHTFTTRFETVFKRMELRS